MIHFLPLEDTWRSRCINWRRATSQRGSILVRFVLHSHCWIRLGTLRHHFQILARTGNLRALHSSPHRDVGNAICLIAIGVVLLIQVGEVGSLVHWLLFYVERLRRTELPWLFLQTLLVAGIVELMILQVTKHFQCARRYKRLLVLCALIFVVLLCETLIGRLFDMSLLHHLALNLMLLLLSNSLKILLNFICLLNRGTLWSKSRDA